MTVSAIGTGRAVEVLHDRGPATSAGGDRWTGGSGYLIGSRLVLTAAHNVDYRCDLGADEQLLVRTIEGNLLAARVVLACDEMSRVDLALLEISDPRFGEQLLPVTFARVNRDSPVPVTGCWAVGFPRFGEAGAVLPGGSHRETWQVSGHILPGGKRRAGLLSLQVTSNPSGSLTGSAWEGMSGGVVFAADAHDGEQAAVGVISTHHRPEGESALTVVPVTAVAELAAAAEWWRQFGVPGLDTLPVLPRQRARAGLVRPTSAAGRPLTEVTDPFVLEVHRPVQPENAPPGLPVLPPYVPREHDQALGQVVRAAAGGRGGIAVLVGGSSTGKTRACWEALQLLRGQDPAWRLWHPIDPSRPDAALAELPGIGPRTVVWLNEAQFYLDTAEAGLGERVAAGLRELLRDPARAPVLVLATLWPGFWDALTARPADGEDRHAQARELLAGHDITVPTAFTPAQMDQLAQAADARMVLAARSARDGAVIQFLAGAPELLARYRNAPPAARALIDAAMDARRLGMGAGLPQAFLEAVAPGYLTDAEWDALGEDWLEQALAYTVVPCKGARGPLTRIRPRPAGRAARGRGDQPGAMTAAAGPLYRLADYLDQHGRAHRASQIPPAEFWSAATAHAAPGDQAAVLRAALEAYGKTGEPEFLDKAIGLADDITNDSGFRDLSHDDAAVIWSLGGAAHIHRGRLDNHIHDLDDAVAWCHRAFEAASDADSNRPAYASNLAMILVERYERDENRKDLDEALTLFDWSVPAIKAAGKRASVALHNQGLALTELYGVDHDIATLNRAIDVLREASADTTEPREVIGGYLNSRGLALRAKAEAASDSSALNEAVRVLRQAREWTIGSADHVSALVNLGNTLLDRSEIGRPVQDLEESIACLEQALTLVARGTSRWGQIASNLASALVATFRATGRQSVLLQARELFADAVDALPDPLDREIVRSNLAACLQDLYDETGEISFLDEAIEIFRVTVSGPAGSTVPERRQNFGVALLARFKRCLSSADLEQAIEEFRAVASLSARGSVIHAAATNSLGNALSLRFDLLGDDEDLSAAVLAYEEAVQSAGQNSIDRAMYRANLGVNLLRRAERSHSAEDMEAAVRQQEIAAADVPRGSQEYIRVLAGLADSLAARAAATGSEADAERAREAYRAINIRQPPPTAVSAETEEMN